MARKKMDLREQRVKFVVAAERREQTLAALCQEFGISRPVGYEWAGGPAFELAGISNTVGALSFAFFAKGGSRECLRNFVDPCRVATNQIAHAASPPTHKRRKDWASSVGNGARRNR